MAVAKSIEKSVSSDDNENNTLKLWEFDGKDEASISEKRKKIFELGEKYYDECEAIELAELIRSTVPILHNFSKAKAAKLILSLLDFFLDLDVGIGIEVQLCKECIAWAKENGRKLLILSLETRLVAWYYDTGLFLNALQLCYDLPKELKKIDEKKLLVEVHLLESKSYTALSELAEAYSALTSARIAANTFYCPRELQSALDLQSGILQAGINQDFNTAYSYFYKAFDGYDRIGSPKATSALKYMLLCNVMLDAPTDIDQIVSRKLSLKYAGTYIDAMKSVAYASYKRSLSDLLLAMENYRWDLEDDMFIRGQLALLYECMLEQNLRRIIEPYSKIDLDFISKSINLPTLQVENKLAQMIIDKQLHGILDQVEGVFIAFEDAVEDKTYQMALEVIENMEKVVDKLSENVLKLL